MADKTLHVDLKWRFERIYLRHVDLELSGAPQVFNMKWQPNVDMNIRGDHRNISEDRFEVILVLTVACKNLEHQVLKMKLDQGALVRVKSGLETSEIQRILSVEATNALFPYIREAADNFAVRMSLPPFLFGHFHFDKIFEEALQQMKLKNIKPMKKDSPPTDEIMN